MSKDSDKKYNTQIYQLAHSKSDYKLNKNVGEPIAIIGIGCRLPGNASSAEELWELLCHGVDVITEIPSDRWNLQKFYNPDPLAPGKTYVRWGGFITDIDKFDAQFFGISPREAAHMDPQQRIMLEVAYQAIEDAGLPIEKLAGTKTGVFVGISTYDYGANQSQGLARRSVSPYTNLGSALSIAANRISYIFNFKGPSISVDTACSSALVATHIACQSIWNGESSLAVVGGVNITFRPETAIGFSKAAMLAPDGRSKSFDASADGYGRSEGVGAVVLKPLSKAIADDDPIYALVRSTAVNQDGRTAGIAVPNRYAQRDVLEEAYQKAGIDPADVQYLEAHGTGTIVGDPLEAHAIGRVMGKNRKPGEKCIVGSIKSNIGHLEAASGIAGLIKAALIIKHGQIPPNLHFEKPNPKIPFEKINIRIPTSLENWPDTGEKPRLAGVNSFGFGGTNAHVVLEGPPQKSEMKTKSNSSDIKQPLILPLTTRSPEALNSLANSFSEFLAKNGAGSNYLLKDICYTASVRRANHDHRLAVVGFDKAGMVENLQAFSAGETRMWMSSGHKQYGKKSKVVFVFSGMGPQWWGMGRELLNHNSLFKEKILECDALLKNHANWSLMEELTKDENTSRINDTQFGQPAVFSVQVALADLWRSWGVIPDAIVGHSVGEVATAYVSGALDIEDAIKLIFHRSRLQRKAAGKGKMLATGLTEQQCKQILDGYENFVSIAAINSPASITLAGDAEKLEEIAGVLEKKEIFWRFLKVDIPFHSPAMEPIKNEFMETLNDLNPRKAAIPIFSTALGVQINGEEMDASYWWKNVRNPVLFAKAIEQISEQEHGFFIEISPHPVLATSISETLNENGEKAVVVPSIRRQEPELPRMLGSLGELYTSGLDIEWAKLIPDGGQMVKIPSYPWQREKYWHESEISLKDRLGYSHPLIGQKITSPYPVWQNEIDTISLKYLNDHRVQDAVIYPAAAYVEMALAAGKEFFEENQFLLENIQFQKMLFLPENESIDIQFVMDENGDSFEIFGKAELMSSSWTRNATGNLRKLTNTKDTPYIELNEIKNRCTDKISSDDYYKKFEKIGLQYGPIFRGIRQIWTGKKEAVGLITVDETIREGIESYQLHPAILDACFQTFMGTVSMNEFGDKENPTLFLPVNINRVQVFKPLETKIWAYANLTKQNDSVLEGNLQIFDDEGNIIVDIQGLHCRAVDSISTSGIENIDRYLYEYQWKLKPRQEIDQKSIPVRFIPSPQQISDSLEHISKSLIEELDRKNHYEKIEPLSSGLCVAFLMEAFKNLNWIPVIGERISKKPLEEKLGIANQHKRLFGRILDILKEEGILSKVKNEWKVEKIVEGNNTNELWQDLISKYPAYQAELILLHRFGKNFESILKGEIDPLQLIFPEGSGNLAEHLYQDSPSYRIYNSLVQHVVAKVIKHLPEGHTIRVLEIGGGTGGTTSYVLPVLPPNSTEYYFTDISMQFMSVAEQKFKNYSFVKYSSLDIGSDPVEQGFELYSFDLIIASNVLHATADLKLTLEKVKQLLVENGLLVLLEGTKLPRSADLIFGTLPGWWLFTDFDLRPSYPLLPWKKWESLLTDVGFSNVSKISDTSVEGDSEQTVMLAQYNGNGLKKETGQAISIDDSSTQMLPEEPGKWLVFTDNQGVGRQLAEQLRNLEETSVIVTHGEAYKSIDQNKYVVRPKFREDMRQVLDRSLKNGNPLRGIIHLWSLDTPLSEDTTTSNLSNAEELACSSVMHLLQSLEEVQIEDSIKLWLVTSGTQPVGELPITNVAQSLIWGMGRVIINEYPSIKMRLIDLSPNSSPEEIQNLFNELWTEDLEDEVALRKKNRYVNRMVQTSLMEIEKNVEKVLPQKMTQTDQSENNKPQSFHLEITTPGLLDSLRFKTDIRKKPGPNEVEIQVYSTALNFKDVVKAMGLLTEVSLEGTSSGRAIGLECSGVIVAVGEEVKEFKNGDEVIAFSPNSFAKFTTTKTNFVRHKPSYLSFEEATTIPLVFITVHYALNHLARIAKDETVLIHAAAGGVGLAAIQMAKRVGAKIIATAGTREKRDFLKALGVHHVMDSRTLDFADEIMDLTNGRGVDVVLNSLSGEALSKSLDILAPYGRFVELGKVDIDQNNKLGLRPFQKNLSFFSVDLDRIAAERPDYAESILQEVMQLFEEGELHPLPFRVFAISDVVNAFHHMTQAKHIGKVIVSLRDSHLVNALNDIDISTNVNGSYLITGGLGGFGLAVAEWLVKRGVKHLVLMSRRDTVQPNIQEAVKTLEKYGVQVEIVKADVSKEQEVARVIIQIEKTMPPLRGLIHSAMVLDDVKIIHLNRERIHKVLAPKVLGAWNLHTNTLNKELDFFVMFSSFASLVGTPGQANYAAANVFLDSLAHLRRAKGLPALTINWGAISDVGYVAENAEVLNYLEKMGVKAIPPHLATKILNNLINYKAVQAGVFSGDWQRWAKIQKAGQSPRFSSLLFGKDFIQSQSGDSGTEGSLRNRILDAIPAERQNILESYMQDQLAKVLGMSPEKVSVNEPLVNLGVDSLMGIEINIRIESELGVKMPPMKLMELNIAKMCQYLIEQMAVKTDK
jgi:acyl transferase domain-containing protein/NADPH:quinone reductase-like Zn-dependent oxidoreductase/SAM-dependent methyltransferase/acyl carrier protein